jgi:hypothetical protein
VPFLSSLVLSSPLLSSHKIIPITFLFLYLSLLLFPFFPHSRSYCIRIRLAGREWHQEWGLAVSTRTTHRGFSQRHLYCQQLDKNHFGALYYQQRHPYAISFLPFLSDGQNWNFQTVLCDSFPHPAHHRDVLSDYECSQLYSCQV